MAVREPDVLDVLDRMRNRFYGKYRGTVTDVDDPSGLLRIKANVPAVLQDQETGWCMPCVPYAGKGVGLALLPEVGAGVWIEFEGGDVSYPIWVGCYWRAGEPPSAASPTAKALVTKSGHSLVLDDDGQSITITDASQNTATFDSNGIALAAGSSKVEVGTASVKVNDGALEVI